MLTRCASCVPHFGCFDTWQRAEDSILSSKATKLSMPFMHCSASRQQLTGCQKQPSERVVVWSCAVADAMLCLATAALAPKLVTDVCADNAVGNLRWSIACSNSACCCFFTFVQSDSLHRLQRSVLVRLCQNRRLSPSAVCRLQEGRGFHPG